MKKFENIVNPWFDSVMDILKEKESEGQTPEVSDTLTALVCPRFRWKFRYDAGNDWWVLRYNRSTDPRYYWPIAYVVTTEFLTLSYLSPADIFVEIIRALTEKGYDTRDLTPSVFMDPWEQYNLSREQGLT